MLKKRTITAHLPFQKCKMFIVILGILAIFIIPQISYAKKSLNDAAGNLENFSAGTGIEKITIEDTVGTIIKSVIGLVGLIFFVLTVYGSIKILISRGDSTMISEGRDTIIMATIGLIVIVSGYAITNFVGDKVISKSTGGGGIDSGTSTDSYTQEVVEEGQGCCLDWILTDNFFGVSTNVAFYLATEEECKNGARTPEKIQNGMCSPQDGGGQKQCYLFYKESKNQDACQENWAIHK